MRSISLIGFFLLLLSLGVPIGLSAQTCSGNDPNHVQCCYAKGQDYAHQVALANSAALNDTEISCATQSEIARYITWLTVKAFYVMSFAETYYSYFYPQPSLDRFKFNHASARNQNNINTGFLVDPITDSNYSTTNDLKLDTVLSYMANAMEAQRVANPADTAACQRLRPPWAETYIAPPG